jgi:DNA (cytosine-5)-methyltransferase 1
MVTIMNSQTLTIAEAASMLSVSMDTIRRWDKKGLIKAERNSSNVRIFHAEELKRAHEKYISGEQSKELTIHVNPNSSEFKTVELFAGAGGLALGLENAGLNHELLVEFNKDAAKTLQANRPDWNVRCQDAREIDYKNVKADIVTGGFPCQAFSFAGKQMGFEDTRGTLFFELARAVKEINPKIAVGENVKGLLTHDNGRTLQTMIKIMNDLGYRVATKVLRAQYLDVPQKRERLIIMCVRNELDIPFIFPKEMNYTVSLKAALKNVPKSDGQKYPERKRKILEIIPPGGYWKDLPDELQREYMGASYFLGGGKTGMARRLAWDEPSLTLTCAPAQKQTERCHPEETRPLTVREYARIQTFPDDWQFAGSTSSIYKQIGNAVPVNLGYFLGKCLIAMLDGKVDQETMQVVKKSEVLNNLPKQPDFFIN